MKNQTKIGMIFPGYGSQFIGMGKELYDNSRIVQEYVEEASNCLNSNVVKLCFASSEAELRKPLNAATALFVTGGALSAVVKDMGIPLSIVSGFDYGLYSALHAAGCLNFPDGLYLLSKYTQLKNDDDDILQPWQLDETLSAHYALYREKVDWKNLELPCVSMYGDVITTGEQAFQALIDQCSQREIEYNTQPFNDCAYIIMPAATVKSKDKIQELFPNAKIVMIDSLAALDELKNLFI